jgi:hypothetical protein
MEQWAQGDIEEIQVSVWPRQSNSTARGEIHTDTKPQNSQVLVARAYHPSYLRG